VPPFAGCRGFLWHQCGTEIGLDVVVAGIEPVNNVIAVSQIGIADHADRLGDPAKQVRRIFPLVTPVSSVSRWMNTARPKRRQDQSAFPSFLRGHCAV
jgi:hypothetical protein